jgi:hypothetical protein
LAANLKLKKGKGTLRKQMVESKNPPGKRKQSEPSKSRVSCSPPHYPWIIFLLLSIIYLSIHLSINVSKTQVGSRGGLQLKKWSTISIGQDVEQLLRLEHGLSPQAYILTWSPDGGTAWGHSRNKGRWIYLEGVGH